MKKIINNSNHMVTEMLNGFYFANQDRVHYNRRNKIIYREKEPYVALISGGGSGHEPAHLEYVGDGMLNAAVHGEIFTPPYPEQIAEAIRLTDFGAGVLLIVKNFAADVELFTEAKNEMLKSGHKIEMVIVNDDVSIENKETYQKRKRGVAGTILVHKIIGAAAREGHSLKALKTLGDTLTNNIFTLGVALEPTIVPPNNTPSFELLENEVSFGIGIHGEKGYRKETFFSSEKLAIELVNKLKRLYKWKRGDSYAVLVNGLGTTPLMEQYIFTNDVRRLLQLEQLNIQFVKVGTHLTSYNMYGISLTLFKIDQTKWIDYLNAPTDATGW